MPKGLGPRSTVLASLPPLFKERTRSGANIAKNKFHLKELLG